MGVSLQVSDVIPSHSAHLGALASWRFDSLCHLRTDEGYIQCKTAINNQFSHSHAPRREHLGKSGKIFKTLRANKKSRDGHPAVPREHQNRLSPSPVVQ